jgi:hypothetical protein
MAGNSPLVGRSDDATNPKDYYVVGNDIRVGVYPGRVVATFESHWAAVLEMIELCNARDDSPAGFSDDATKALR